MLNRREILRAFANLGVVGWIPPDLKFFSALPGEVDTSAPNPTAEETRRAGDEAPIFARGACNWGVYMDWFLCPWFGDKDRTRFDAADWMRRLKEAGFDYVVLESRYISGLWLYPSQDPMWTSGFTYDRDSNPDELWPKSGRIVAVSRDYVSELAREAKRQGLRLVITIWVTDSAVGIIHPEWMLHDEKGNLIKETQSTQPSFASPFADYTLRELKGMLERSPNIEAVRFDGLMENFGVISYDRYYREAFQKRFGKPMGSATEAELWQLQEDVYGTFLQKVRAVLNGSPSRAQLLCTAAATYFLLPPGPERDSQVRVNKLLDDLYEEGHELSRESSSCKLLRSTGPYELTSPQDLFWTEYLFRPWTRVALEAAIIFSQGGNFATSIRPFQSGLLTKGETDNLVQAGQWIKKRKPYFPNTVSVADAAIWFGPMVAVRNGVQPLEPPAELWPGLQQFLKLPMDPGDNGGMIYDRYLYRKPGNGLENSLLEHHIPFDVLPPEDDFDKYQVVILQDGVCMDDTVAQKLRRYVDNGGTLLAEGHASLLNEAAAKRTDFALADVFGLSYTGYSPHVDVHYLAIADARVASGLPDHPLLVEGGSILVKTSTARPLGWLVYPAANRLEYRTLGAHNSPGDTTSHPAITRNRFGKGEAIYVAVPLGRHIMLRGSVDPWTKQLTANLVRELVARPLYRTDAPAGMEIVFNRQADRYVVHFLNYYTAMDNSPSTAKLVRLGRFDFELNAQRVPKIERAFLAPDNKKVRFQRNENWWTFQFEAPDPIDTILVLEPGAGS
jgi:Beta-galactosidase trimerisation domain/Alpha-L-fucosidase